MVGHDSRRTGFTVAETVVVLVLVLVLASIAVPTYQAVVRESHDRAAELSLEAVSSEAAAQATIREQGFSGFSRSDFDPSIGSLDGQLSLVASTSLAYGQLSVAVDPSDTTQVALAMLSKSGRCARGALDGQAGDFWTADTPVEGCAADLSATSSDPDPTPISGPAPDPPAPSGELTAPTVTAVGVEAQGSGADSTAGVDVSWTTAAGDVVDYYVSISTDATFTASGSWADGQPMTVASTSTSVRFTLADGCIWLSSASGSACYPVSYGTTYYVMVQARDAAGNGPWSSIVEATPYTTPGTATVSGLTSADEATFLYNIPDDGGTPIVEYDYEIADNADFVSAIGSTASATSPTGTWMSLSRDPGGFAYDDVEHHRIRFRNAAGWGPWSSSVVMRTAMAPVAGLNVQLAIEEPRDGVSDNVSLYAAWEPSPAANVYEFRVWVDEGVSVAHGKMVGAGAGSVPGLYLNTSGVSGSYDVDDPYLYATGLEHGRSFRFEVRACIEEQYPTGTGAATTSACSAWGIVEPTQSKTVAWPVRQGNSVNFPEATTWVDTVSGRRAYYGQSSEPAGRVGGTDSCTQVPSDTTYTMQDQTSVFYQPGDHRYGGCGSNYEYRFRTDAGAEPAYNSSTIRNNTYTYQSSETVTCPSCTPRPIVWSAAYSAGWSSWQTHPDVDTSLGATASHYVTEPLWGTTNASLPAADPGVWVYVWNGSTWQPSWHAIESGSGLPWTPVSYEGSFIPPNVSGVEIHVRLVTEAQSNASSDYLTKTSATTIAFDIWVTGDTSVLANREVRLTWARDDISGSYPASTDAVGGAILPAGYLSGATQAAPRNLTTSFSAALGNPADTTLNLWGLVNNADGSGSSAYYRNTGASAIRQS